MNQTRLRHMKQGAINTGDWPTNSLGILAKNYFESMLNMGTDKFIENAHVDIEVIILDDIVLPIAICQEKEDSSYVCSICSHYINYAFEELEKISNRYLKKGLLSVVKTLRPLFRFFLIDKVVYVNNWLISTNLYPDLSQEQIETLTKYLTDRFPDYAIVFRSVNDWHPHKLQDNLKQSKYSLVPNRKIYYTDTDNNSAYKSRMFKSDLKVLKNTEYTMISKEEITEEDHERIAELYRMLNIEKYSELNPQINDKFISLIHKTPGFTLKAWKKDGVIDAVLGYYRIDDAITSPLFGYDTSLPQELGLYRIISTQLLLDAKEQGLKLHQSSGGVSYKKLRRAEETIESLTVYHRHLPIRRRVPWNILSVAMNVYGKRLL